MESNDHLGAQRELRDVLFVLLHFVKWHKPQNCKWWLFDWALIFILYDDTEWLSQHSGFIFIFMDFDYFLQLLTHVCTTYPYYFS